MVLVLILVSLVMEMTVSEKFGDFITICDMLGLQVRILDDVKVLLKTTCVNDINVTW